MPRAALKKSDRNRVFITVRMSAFESMYALTRMSIASWSIGGVTLHAGICGSSATKKL